MAKKGDAEPAGVAIDDSEWRESFGVHFLCDSKGRVIAEVRRTDDFVYSAKYGNLQAERYWSLEDARIAMKGIYMESLSVNMSTGEAKKVVTN